METGGFNYCGQTNVDCRLVVSIPLYTFPLYIYVSLLLSGPDSLTRYCQSAYSSEMALGQAFDGFPVLRSSSGRAHAGASVGAGRETRPAAAPAELSAGS